MRDKIELGFQVSTDDEPPNSELGREIYRSSKKRLHSNGAPTIVRLGYNSQRWQGRTGAPLRHKRLRVERFIVVEGRTKDSVANSKVGNGCEAASVEY